MEETRAGDGEVLEGSRLKPTLRHCSESFGPWHSGLWGWQVGPIRPPVTIMGCMHVLGGETTEV